jgi:hypothetical protein
MTLGACAFIQRILKTKHVWVQWTASKNSAKAILILELKSFDKIRVSQANTQLQEGWSRCYIIVSQTVVLLLAWGIFKLPTKGSTANTKIRWNNEHICLQLNGISIVMLTNSIRSSVNTASTTKTSYDNELLYLWCDIRWGIHNFRDWCCHLYSSCVSAM